MESFVWDGITSRWLLSLTLITLVLALEWAVPFKVSVERKIEHASTNFIIFGGNSLIAQLFAGWMLLLWSSYVSSEEWGLLYSLHLSLVPHVIASVITLDLAAYGIHRLYHRVPLLWRFHRAHHSDLDVDATTSIRFHLGEVLFTSGVKGLLVWTLGISPAGFVVSEMLTFTVGLFSHGNVRLPANVEPRLRLAIVTPNMHWIHHSRRSSEHNANLSAVFSGWDRLFGTYCRGEWQQEIQFGLDEYPMLEDVSLFKFYRIPFDPPCRPIPGLAHAGSPCSSQHAPLTGERS
jgi:sterol desaturase/sphingolipid hydroxylase (fatty acid hydroxylase superfamily)